MSLLVKLAAPLYLAAMSFDSPDSPAASLPECSSEIVALFEAGQYPDAAKMAEECMTRTAHPRLLYFAGQGHQNAGRYGAALYAYLEFLRNGTDESRLLTDARKRVDELRALTTAIVFSVDAGGASPDAEPKIVLEQMDTGYPPLVVELTHCEGSKGARTLPLERGLWKVQVLLDGFATEQRLLRINALSETITVAITLEPIASPSPPVPFPGPSTPSPLPNPSAPRPAPDLKQRPRLIIAESVSYGAVGVTLGIAGSAVVGIASRQDTQMLSNGDRVERDIAFYSSGAGLLGGSLGAGIGAVTRYYARSPTPLFAEFGVGAAFTATGWALFGLTSGNLRSRDMMHPDSGWSDTGRVAASALAGLGMALIVTSAVSWVSDRIQKRKSARAARRPARNLSHRFSPTFSF